MAQRSDGRYCCECPKLLNRANRWQQQDAKRSSALLQVELFAGVDLCQSIVMADVYRKVRLEI